MKNPVDHLPEELWFRILETGIQEPILMLKDISSLSISCKFFNKLLNEDALWSRLIAQDFPPDFPKISSSSCSTKKLLYKHTLARYLLQKKKTAQLKIRRNESQIGRLDDAVRDLRQYIGTVNAQMDALSQRLRDLINNCDSALCSEEKESLNLLRGRMIQVTEEAIVTMDKSDQDLAASIDYLTNLHSLSKSDGPSSVVPSSLVGLVTDTNELLSLHRGILVQHQQVQCQIYNLRCDQVEQSNQLETFASCFDSLRSGPNPVEIRDDVGVEYVDDYGEYDENDSDEDSSDDDDDSDNDEDSSDNDDDNDNDEDNSDGD